MQHLRLFLNREADNFVKILLYHEILKHSNETQQARCFTGETEAMLFQTMLVLVHLMHWVEFILYIQITFNFTI